MNPVRLIKIVALLSALSFLFVFGMGCSSMKEATAAPIKVTPVPPVAPAGRRLQQNRRGGQTGGIGGYFGRGSGQEG